MITFFLYIYISNPFIVCWDAMILDDANLNLKRNPFHTNQAMT
jgi:hypothetical protein